MPQLTPNRVKSSHASRLTVIGIGASAGGLDAVTQLIEAWPPNSALSFILVQHSDPSGGSMLATLLAPHTALTVIEAEDLMPVEPNHLYIMPPGRYLSASEGVLHLSNPLLRPGARLPFDFLLESLSKAYGEHTACVVLSGTGADGSAGLAAIKAAGGKVAVQDPAEARYSGMPESAIATGLADFVLPIAKIPAALCSPAPPKLDAAGISDECDPADADVKTLVSEGLPEILELLRVKAAHDFALYKPGTLQRRIDRRITLAGLKPDEIARYIILLRADHEELQALAADLLIHVTAFFRDEAVFEQLAATTIPEMLASRAPGQPLRIWVPGCSTGEEAYSLAMLFMEQIENKGLGVKLQVFASDVDADAIAAAREGCFPDTIEESMPPSRLARFFVREDAKWRAVPDLRAAIVYTVQNVLTDPPFSRLDMISCRNLLIYLMPDAQLQVLDAFHFALCDGGILLLGSAETVIAPEGRFETVARSERIYRRVGRAAGMSTSARPGLPTRVALVRPGDDRRGRAVGLPLIAGHPAALAELGRRLVMEAYAPASVLVDAADAVVFSIGPTDRYLRLPSGHATQDLLAMARPGLRSKLRAALQAARESKAIVRSSGWITGDGASNRFSLAVHPVMEAGQELLLVCFPNASLPHSGVEAPTSHADVPQIAELRRELDATRSELQGTVRDLELSGEEQRAINEEALSVNEEYQSTNEELVASKEEFQSLNEELTAVNSQLQETLERQRATSDDLQNVLYSTDVATLFLDLEGRIRFFTPAIAALFAIISTDVGRKLTDFAALTPDATLAGDMSSILGGEHAMDREIEGADGKWFLRRIMPYRAHRGVEGVVITFADISERKAVDQALESAKMDAEAANAAKTRFLAAASHDLRQPLQTLALLQDLLANMVTTEKAKALAARQSVTLSTVTGMLDSLLDINEIEAGAVHPHFSVIAIGGLLDRMRDEFSYHAQAKGIELRVVACSRLTRSDPRLLEQMVRNLLSNAIKYTVNGRILLGCRLREGSLSLKVCDTGIGMDDTSLSAIFEEYYQVGNEERQRSRGLGLGLSIVKRLSGLLGHPVRVRSRPGHGSVFAIDLPLVAGTETQPTGIVQPSTEHDMGLKILVVEDDPDLEDALSLMLQSQGHKVTSVHDGPAALHAVALEAPDLVISDYNLPGHSNGLDLAKQIRVAVGRSMPVLILTGDIATSTIRAVAGAGCALLSKPTSQSALLGVIGHLMDTPADAGQPVVFVVDDDDGVRSALIALIEADGRLAAGYPSGEAFLQAYQPRIGDCLLIDAALPGISGIGLLEQLRASGDNLPVIVITGQSDVPMAIRAMKAGASDFFEKPVNRAGLLPSIFHALEGARDAATMTVRRRKAAAQVAALTPRQREIMRLVLAGHPSKNIAADLGISQRTVENHRASIMERTGTASLPALARLVLAAEPVAAI